MATQTQPLTAAQAQELAKEFHDIAAAIGMYRLAQVNNLSDKQQFRLQNLQLQCIQFSDSFITLGLFAQQASLAVTLQTIKQQTTAAQQAISTINTVDKVLEIATAAAVLGASVASMNPSAVASGVQGLITVLTATPTVSSGTSTGATTTPNQSSGTPGG
jgi:hypothetical protein